MKSLSHTAARSFVVVSAAVSAMTLSACSQQARPGSLPTLVQPIGNDRQVEDVVAALKLGDVKRARKLLKAMAKRDPADQRVATMRQSLEGDPSKLLGTLFFSYRVESGDQLTTLSTRFLGDRLKFYLLARYNKLTTDALQPGQLIRIPGRAPAPKPRPETRSDPQLDPRPHQRPATSPSPARANPTPPAAAVANPAEASRLRGLALVALNSGAVAKGVVILRRARALDPANVPIKNDLARAERLLAAVKARR